MGESILKDLRYPLLAHRDKNDERRCQSATNTSAVQGRSKYDLSRKNYCTKMNLLPTTHTRTASSRVNRLLLSAASSYQRGFLCSCSRTASFGAKRKGEKSCATWSKSSRA